jgi:hypothetical protein
MIFVIVNGMFGRICFEALRGTRRAVFPFAALSGAFSAPTKETGR